MPDPDLSFEGEDMKKKECFNYSNLSTTSQNELLTLVINVFKVARRQRQYLVMLNTAALVYLAGIVVPALSR